MIHRPWYAHWICNKFQYFIVVYKLFIISTSHLFVPMDFIANELLSSNCGLKLKFFRHHIHTPILLNFMFLVRFFCIPGIGFIWMSSYASTVTNPFHLPVILLIHIHLWYFQYLCLQDDYYYYLHSVLMMIMGYYSVILHCGRIYVS